MTIELQEAPAKAEPVWQEDISVASFNRPIIRQMDLGDKRNEKNLIGSHLATVIGDEEDVEI